MQIIRVDDRKTRKEFLDTARFLYRNDGTWVCPLDRDVEEIFTKGKNPFYEHGDASRWILRDDNGIPAGRIAAFINNKLAYSYEQPTGGIGFFECINDKSCSQLLFNTAKEWLIAKGMEAMDGPINFGEIDKNWGLLIEGFTHPSFDVVYNHKYYGELFESYGFMKYYAMEGFHADLASPFPERFLKIASWVEKKPGYEYRHFTWTEKNRFVNDFLLVFNEAWSNYKKDFIPLEAGYINKVLDKARLALEEDFIWFAYYHGQPIAILLAFPDINQILKHMGGKMHVLNILKFIYLRNKKTMTRVKGLLMGIIPKFHNLGIESALFLQFYKAIRKKPHYTEIELSWVGDFNPKMRRTFVNTGGAPVKKYIVYRYLFDRNKEFKRYPIHDFPGVP
ncbi:MAG: GNAT family N-acetyltransferase [Chloroflexota bacterium]